MARRPPTCSSKATCWSRRRRSVRASPAISSASTTPRPPPTSARRSRTCRNPTTRASRPSRSAWPSRRPRRGRRRRRSSSAWRKPAAARSSARSCCRWRPPPARSASSRRSATRTSRKATRPSSTSLFAAPDGKTLARPGLRYELLKIESRYQWYRQNSSWEYEPVKTTTRVADGELDIAADKPSHLSFRRSPAAIAST